MKKQYRSRLMASIHETAQDLADAGVMSKQRVRQFDKLCLTPVKLLSPAEIRELRERADGSAPPACSASVAARSRIRGRRATDPPIVVFATRALEGAK